MMPLETQTMPGLRPVGGSRRLWAITLLVIALIVAVSVSMALSRRAAILADATEDLSSVSDSVVQDAFGTFELSNTVLTSLSNSMGRSGGTIRQMEEISGDVAAIARAAPRFREVLFAELGGWVLASSLEKNGINRNVAREKFFRNAAEIGSAAVSANQTKEHDVVVSRQVASSDGMIAGVIATIVPKTYFQQTYTSFDAGRSIGIRLRQLGGTTLVSYGPDGGAGGPDATVIERSLAPLPFVVSVARARSAMLNDWTERLPLQILNTAGLLVLTAVIALLVSRLSARRREEAQALARQATTDPLTGLGNRRLFMEGVRAAIEHGASSGFAVVLLDLDRFKSINDTHGHAAGDLVLTATAGHLSRRFGGSGLVARLGGDEFAILVNGVRDRDDLGRELLALGAAINTPIAWRSTEVTVGSSIGVAMFPDDGADGDALLQSADLAMYRAKQARANEVRFFEPGMEVQAATACERERELREAIERDEIRAYYQPIVSLPDRRIVGFELLARWHHREKGVLAPGEFIELAEDTGLITPLTLALIRQAGRDCAAWPEEIQLAINISPRQLKEPLLASELIQTIQAAGIPPHRAEVELTEDGILDDYELAKSVLSIFRLHGITLALDDFGTGYSSLSHLRELRFDKLKIDRSFVQGLPDNAESRKLVDVMLQLAGSFDMTVTAEGIETAEQAAFLAERGCARGQGFLFGRPLPAAETLILLGRAAPCGIEPPFKRIA